MTVATGVLLTGGSGRRLGAPKASLVFDDETLARRAARVLVEACGRAVEVGPGCTELPAIREDPPGSGPLAALVAGYRWAGGPVLLLACDLPLVTVDHLRDLARRPGTAIPRVRDELQYACARYDVDAGEEAATVVAEGGRSLRALVDRLVRRGRVDVVEGDRWSVVAADVDTAADAQRLGIELPGRPV